MEQVLKPIVFPFWETLSDEDKEWWRFIEDGSGVHKGFARLPRLERGVRGFDWSPSSPDLNPIEKVWRWMKNEITKLEHAPTTREDLIAVLKELWHEINPEDWRYLTHRMVVKLDDVIRCKGMVTVH